VLTSPAPLGAPCSCSARAPATPRCGRDLFTVVGLLRCRELRFPLRDRRGLCGSGGAARDVSLLVLRLVRSMTTGRIGRSSAPASNAPSRGRLRRREISAKTWNVFLKHPLGVGYGGTNKYIGGDLHNSHPDRRRAFAAALFLVAGLALVARNAPGLRHADLVGPVAVRAFRWSPSSGRRSTAPVLALPSLSLFRPVMSIRARPIAWWRAVTGCRGRFLAREATRRRRG
jgi:hypothetical protein